MSRHLTPFVAEVEARCWSTDRLALAKFETLAYTLANEKRKALVENWL